MFELSDIRPPRLRPSGQLGLPPCPVEPYDCYLDGLDAAHDVSCPRDGPEGGKVPLSNLSDGTHTFSVVAGDITGNIDASPASFSWNVNKQLDPGVGPDAQIDLPKPP